jgi:hypothetical protein
MTLPYKLIIGALLLLISFILGAGAAFTYEHSKLVSLESDLKTAAAIHDAAVSKLNATIQENANEATQTLTQSNAAIADYYKHHPATRVLYRDGSCQVSQALGNSSSADGAASSVYAAPYSAEQCEVVANRLNVLQHLLTTDGVTVQ